MKNIKVGGFPLSYTDPQLCHPYDYAYDKLIELADDGKVFCDSCVNSGDCEIDLNIDIDTHQICEEFEPSDEAVEKYLEI